MAAQLLADRARRRALGLLQLAAAAPPVRLGEPCSSTPAPAPPMPTPADDLAQLLAAVMAYRPQPRAWPPPHRHRWPLAPVPLIPWASAPPAPSISGPGCGLIGPPGHPSAPMLESQRPGLSIR